MNEHTAERSEQFLRFSHTSLVLMLIVVLLLGATCLALIFLPEGGGFLRMETVLWWLAPVAVAGAIAFGISARRRRWNHDMPEVRAVMDDEWRRTSLDRATRVALVMVLVAQFPVAWVLHFAGDAPLRWTIGVGATTIVIGLVTLLGLLVYLDRD